MKRLGHTKMAVPGVSASLGRTDHRRNAVAQIWGGDADSSSMQSHGAHSSAAHSANAPDGTSGLSPQHRAALGEAAEMIGRGASPETAVDHLVASGMPRIVAKVLVKQYDKRAN